MASSPQINALNEQLRQSPQYAQWMRAKGIDPSRPIRLSDQQRREFAAYLRTHGVQIPRGAEIDPAGNVNENEGAVKQAKRWGPIAAAGAVTAFGVPGLFPGLLTKGGATAAGALPTSAKYTNLGIQAGMRGAPTASMLTPAAALAGTAGGFMNQAIPPAISALGGTGGGTGMIPPTGGGGVLNTIGNVGRRVLGGGNGGMNPWQIAALAGLAGLPALLANRGMGDEEKAIYNLLRQDLDEARGDREQDRSLRGTQLRRIQYQDPLYQAVTQLAMNRLPMDTQRPLGDL